MSHPWSAILNKLNLSRAEQAAVKRFEQDQGGRGFLAVADILRAHRKYEESIELLMEGVDRHPTFTVARVVLARELYSRGMLAQSWHVLMGSTQQLADNVLAQKLKLKLAILVGLDDIVEEVTRHMFLHQMHDDETRKLAEAARSGKMRTAIDQLAHELRSQGIEPVIPRRDEIEAPLQKAAVALAKEDEPALEAEEKKDRYPEFHVLPLHEIMRGQDYASSSDGVELDSTTLADLYIRQGHFSKALAIYRRLLRLTPQNDYLKRKIREINQMEKKQKDQDLSVDPSVVDQMEQVEGIDRQMQFYRDMLEKVEKRYAR